jgi:hypothetical protein
MAGIRQLLSVRALSRHVCDEFFRDWIGTQSSRGDKARRERSLWTKREHDSQGPARYRFAQQAQAEVARLAAHSFRVAVHRGASSLSILLALSPAMSAVGHYV